MRYLALSRRARGRLFASTLATLVALLTSSESRAAGSPATRDEMAKQLAAWLDPRVPERMREAKLPGFSIAAVKDGETVYAEGFGARDPARGLPATADTLFGVGSVTKSFVAVAILQLADAGRLRLDDPVSKYVPLEIGAADAPVTIHHLLTHTAGFPNLGTSTILLGRGLGRDSGVPIGSDIDFYRFVNGAAAEVVARPGERYFYSNESWRMLGHIVQVVSGMPFHRYLTERVIRPLGMTRTTMVTSAVLADADHLTPHRIGDAGPEATAIPYPNPEDNLDFSFIAAAGGLFSSANEMTRYVNALIARGRHPGGRLASEEAFAKMQSSHIRTGADVFGERGYGYGLAVSDFLGERLLAHGGSISVSTAYMAFVPALGIGVVMMGNGPALDYDSLAREVLAILAGEDPESVLPGAAIRERMERLTGSYATYREIETMTIFRRDGMLYMGLGAAGGSADVTPLVPEDMSYRTLHFRILDDGSETPLEFFVGDNGAVAAILDRNVFHRLSASD